MLSVLRYVFVRVGHFVLFSDDCFCIAYYISYLSCLSFVGLFGSVSCVFWCVFLSLKTWSYLCVFYCCERSIFSWFFFES